METSAKDTVSKSLTTAPAANVDEKPVVSPPYTWYQKVNLGLRIWLFKALVVVALGAIRVIQGSKFRAIGPNYSKAYKKHPSLKCRIFLPKKQDPDAKLPLYIDIHGGGFALCDPQTDDAFCRHFADHFGYCVVSINYRKSPSYPWPVPVEDCADLARAVLADPDLPVDHDKVVLGGFSAGGNLSLAIAQLDGIRDKIKAVIPFYPACDFTSRHRGKFMKDQEGKDDMLQNTTKLFNWAYVPSGTDRRQKTLSPIYANKQDLPQPMFFVGAQYDILCTEANVMAKKLAGIEEEQDPGTAWEKNGIRWEMVPNVQHGFTHVNKRGAKEAERVKLCEDLYQRVHDWIRQQWAPS